MSLPEISRRCRACGASVRAGGRFCQQCGTKLGEGEAAAAVAESDAAMIDTVRERDEARAADAPHATSPRDAQTSSPQDAQTSSPQDARALNPREPKASNAVASDSPSGIFQRPHAPPRATPAPDEAQKGVPDSAAPAPAPGAASADAPLARGRRAAAMRESLRPRVERVRDASMGVIEEASEDTGLRFVLISVGVFLLFLLLLLLNYVLQ
ncbi:MAG TPA: zinc ribbon domain-containing protein [Pyrinomonadaceae bacterium]|nr:zinc ribbon domain-containing protein [Pyrinomonadaceae bacterium]